MALKASKNLIVYSCLFFICLFISCSNEQVSETSKNSDQNMTQNSPEGLPPGIPSYPYIFEGTFYLNGEKGKNNSKIKSMLGKLDSPVVVTNDAMFENLIIGPRNTDDIKNNIEFYLILAAVKKVPTGIFWRILIGSIVMLVGGYMGEAGFIAPMLGFIIGMAGWIYILYEIFSGEAGKTVARSGNKSLVTAFGALRMIVTVGWAIYPLGYVFGYLTGGIDANSLNVIYNLADFVNKIAFGVIIWSCAVANSRGR